YMYEPLQRVPGVVVLHDLMWSHVLYTACHARGELAEFRRQVAELEGQDALESLVAIEERATRDLVSAHRQLWTFLSEHPMLTKVIEGSLAQVVHFESAREELESRYPGSAVRVVPMGVRGPRLPPHPLRAADTRLRLGLGLSTFVIGVFGIVHPVKRVESCVRAVSRLLPDHPDTVLLVVGEALDPGYQRDLVTLASDLGALPHVRFAGYVPKPEFDSQLECCDVIVNLRAPLTKHMSATLVRALAAARPLVVTELPDWQFLPPDVCLQVPTGETEVDVLTRHLAALADDPELRARLSAAAFDYYRAEASIERMAEGYREVIADFPAGRAP
ncbi:MAG: glycosyltransferase, partial [Actinomycetota bacterium]|nr:glycosyltransferase [Actinomycetota bacterium]